MARASRRGLLRVRVIPRVPWMVPRDRGRYLILLADGPALASHRAQLFEHGDGCGSAPVAVGCRLGEYQGSSALLGSAAQLLLQALKFFAVLISNELRDLFCKGWVVGVACEVAAADHRHPGVFCTGGQKLSHHGLSHSISSATKATDALIDQKVLEQKPAELVGEFKGLD